MDWDLVEEVVTIPENVVPENSPENLLVQGDSVAWSPISGDAFVGVKKDSSPSEFSAIANADDEIIITDTPNGPTDVDTGGTFMGGNTGGAPNDEMDSPLDENGQGEDEVVIWGEPVTDWATPYDVILLNLGLGFEGGFLEEGTLIDGDDRNGNGIPDWFEDGIEDGTIIIVNQ